jgi:carbonic anhydrase
MKIIHAVTLEDIGTAKTLFLEYAASLGFELCFQSFDEELAGLPGDYAPPYGALLIAVDDGAEVRGEPTGETGAEVVEERRVAAGCAALRRLDAETCEIKRLYVRPSCRGKGIGRALAETVVAEARKIGYQRMRLDAIRNMTAAVGLYASMGFKQIAPYRHNPIPGAVYLELSLE